MVKEVVNSVKENNKRNKINGAKVWVDFSPPV